MTWRYGILEYFGIMGPKGLILFFDTAVKTEIKIRTNSIFKPNIPLFHPSKGGSSTFHHSIGRLMVNSTRGEIKPRRRRSLRARIFTNNCAIRFAEHTICGSACRKRPACQAPEKQYHAKL
jgi:hypothetical protein